MLMRKFLLGLLLGIMIAVAAPAYGAVSSFVGKSVQGEYLVKVDGSPLVKKSIAIDGTTYAPLRAIGEAVGYDVDFVDKTVVFTKKSDSSKGSETVDKVTYDNPYDISTDQMTLEQLNILIQWAKGDISTYSGCAVEERGNSEERRQYCQEQKEKIEAKLAEMEARKAELEAQQQ